MSNSTLVSYTNLSNKHSGLRKEKIDRITPHCVVGQWSAKKIADYFKTIDRDASCNYGIGKDGDVCLVVEENYRSWCSSSNANDQRAVTIECASDTRAPYKMNDKVYNTLVDLCTDICFRNGKKKLLWFGDKNKSLNYVPAADEMVLTVHRWFSNKSCPGDWLYSRLGDVAAQVSARLEEEAVKPENVAFPRVPFTVQVIVDDLNYRSEPSMEGKVNGQTGKGVFTIVEVKDGWGKLKSGVGWIWLENPSCCAVNKKVSTTKTVNELAREVIAGKWGNGVDRKQKLTSAGYDYSAVQKRVNELMK